MKLRCKEPGYYQAISSDRARHFVVLRTTTGGFWRDGTGRGAVDVKVPLVILWKVYLNGAHLRNFLTLSAARRFIAEQD